MNVYSLRLPKGNHHSLQTEPRDSTDKIAGSFSTVFIAFSFIKHPRTTNTSIVVVNEKHTTTAKTMGEPASEMADKLVRSLIKLVQNKRLNRFAGKKFLENIRESRPSTLNTYLLSLRSKQHWANK